MALPKWAKKGPKTPDDRADVYVIDVDKMYPAMLAELAGVSDDIDPDKPTKYALECAYQCAKLDMQRAVGWPESGANVEFRFKGTKDWALRNFPGTEADVIRATKGLEAREHYKRLRGSLPGGS